jgi:taurine dioxygenase
MYQRIKVDPINPAIGAEISGVDLGSTLDDATFDELKDALHRHLVVFVRDQQMTPEVHKELASRFGKIETHEVFKHLPDHPEVTRCGEVRMRHSMRNQIR